jgi:CubicO group peptidase (beta-lactamase class C family)
MHDTSYDPTTAPGRFAWLSTWESVPNAQIPLTREQWTRYTISLASPAFGLWSTAGDLVALGQALLSDLLHGTGTVLSSAYVELMTREHTAGIPQWGNGTARPSSRGLAWGRNQPTLPGSSRVFKHGGSEAGLLWIDPAYDLVYVFLGSRSCRGIEGQFLPLQAVYGAFRG